MRPARIGTVAAALLLASGSLAGAALPAKGRVTISIIPGKPDAPTETVTVSWRDGSGLIRAERRVAGVQELAAGESPLDEKRLRKLWQAVERNRLTTFHPRESAGQVFDFGSRHVFLEWTPRPGEPGRAHDFSWIKPLDNDADVQPLLRAAADDARAAAPGVTLVYFPATGSRPR